MSPIALRMFPIALLAVISPLGCDSADGGGGLLDTSTLEDTVAGPEDTAAGPEDTATGPEDSATGPEDTATGPKDTATGPQDIVAPPVTHCVSDVECAGHPDGERCVVFEERCGQCLSYADCPANQVCSPTFECWPLTDAICAAESPSSPYLVGGGCGECREDGHCTDPDRPACGPGGRCVACTGDNHCAASGGHCTPAYGCGECGDDGDCGGDTPRCNGWGQCVACQDSACPSDKPVCGDDGDCVECNWLRKCDTADGWFCIEGTCTLEAVGCSDDGDCDDHSTLTQCLNGTCAECNDDGDCGWDLFDHRDVCDPAAGVCVECLANDDCDGEPPLGPFGKVCRGDNRCVECLGDGDCDGEATCGLDRNFCEPPECTIDAHCTDAGTSACSDARVCVECTADSHCAGVPNLPHCLDTRCAQCTQDSHCAGVAGAPYCFEGRCAPCTQDSHCAGVAGAPNCWRGQCAECADAADCVGSPYGSNCVAGLCGQDPAVCSAWTSCVLDLTEYVCGVYVNGCGGQLACGDCGAGDCAEGGRRCDCPADAGEVSAGNDSAATAADAGDFADSPDSSFAIPDMNLHDDDDVDWYSFSIEDAGFDGDPIIAITLDAIAASDSWNDASVYELTLFLRCNNGAGDDTECTSGARAVDATHGVACTASGVPSNSDEPLAVTGQLHCAGTLDDSGVALVRVRKTLYGGLCDGYALTGTIH